MSDLIGAARRYTRKRGEAMTNAEKIRAMSDEELATWILENIACDKENIMCCPELYKSSGKCNGRCIAGRLNWLKLQLKKQKMMQKL